MGEIKQLSVKNKTYYFYNDIINLDEFDGSKISIIDMKGKFRKGKNDNAWYLIIYLDADVLRNFANI